MFESFEIVFVERPLEPVDQLEGSHHFPAPVSQRHTQQVAGGVAGFLVDVGVEAVVGGHVVDLHGMPIVDHVTDDSGVVGNSQRAAFHTQRRAGDQFASLAVVDEDARAVTIQQTSGLRGDQLEQRDHLVDTRKARRCVQC